MDVAKFAKEEFIGLNVCITNSNDPSWIGKKGLVIDETKNTFKIKINGINKTIAKKNSQFMFEYNGMNINLDGLKINYKPEDRIKKTG